MKKFITLAVVLLVTFTLFAEVDELIREQSIQELSPLQTTAPASDVQWDMLLQFDVDTPTGQVGLAGMEWDGTYFYATKWSGSDQLFKFDATGSYIEPVTVPLTGCRDVAHDGTYFYGSAASSSVSCWEPETGTAVAANNVNVAGQSVRAIAYDEATDTFWSGNWGDNVVNWDRSGTILNSYPWAGSMYGMAYDNDPTGGPYLYAHSQDPGCSVYQLDPTDLTQLQVFDATSLGAAGAIAGGACEMQDWDPAYRTLGLLLQGSPDYIVVLELAPGSDPNAPGAPTDVAVIPDAGGALEALITWVCPSVTVGGAALTDLTEMQVWRGDDLIYTDTSPSIGGPGTYNDVSVPASGTYTYTVVGVNASGDGLPVSASSWVGEDVPAAVENLTAIQTTPGTLDVTVSWDNPTTGLNGGPFNNPVIGYHLTQYPDNIIFELTGITTSWSTTVLASGTYWWEVVPYNVTGDGGVAVTDPLFLAGPGLFVEDFEGSNGGYTSGGTADCWEWGTPNFPEGPATAHSGTNCWGTVLTGTFPNSSQCYLQTIPITLPTGNAFFSFYHWYDFGPSNWDGGNLKISTNSGSTWELIYPDGGYPEDELASSNPLYPEPGYCGEPGLGWVEATFDLSTYAGQEVLIKFDFGSTSVVEHPGWYIDDVMYEISGGDPGTIEGNVMLDGGTGNVQDVEVTAGGVTVNPDANGDYVITINPGTYDVTATLDGYEDDTYPGVVVTEGNATTDIDLVLTYIPVVLDPPTNLAVDDMTGLFTWDAPGGGGGDLYELIQHDGNAENAYFQAYDNGYGVVYDLSGYTDVTVEMVDFRHSSWGIFGTWDYSIHIVDWDTYTELAEVTGLQTTGDDIWEEGIDLGSVSESGLVGIFLEPMGNDPADAYPCLDSDNVGPDGMSYYGPLSDYSGMALSDIGDFLMDLWIMGTETDGMVKAPRVAANFGEGNSRLNSTVPGFESFIPTQTSRELQSFNVYLDGDMEGNTDATEWQFENLVNGQTYTAGVEAVYDEGISDLVTIDFTYNGTGAGNNLVAVNELIGNYPNPFNPSTTIAFNLANACHVTIDVYNIKGEKVRTLVDGQFTASSHTVTWDGIDEDNKQVASGVYFYKMKADKFVQTKKMILMK